MDCYGCGQKLQSVDETLSGYVPEKILNSKDNILCQRCFKLQHYNTNSEVELVDSDYEKILSNITSKDALLVYIIDIFNFEASMIVNLTKYLKKQKLLVLVNKRDIIPTAVKDEKIIAWVKARLAKEGLTTISDILISSAQTNYNIDLIMDKIDLLRDKKDVYIIGNANVGKSTFINSLLKNYSNETDNFITTSFFPGTTLNVIRIPLDYKSFIYDTPGIIMKGLIWNIIEPNLLRYIIPRKEVKPITFQLKENQALLIGGLAVFEYLTGPSKGFTCYFSNYVNIHRSRSDKKEISFNNLVKNKNIRPNSSFIKSFKDLIEIKIKVKDKEKVDLVIGGYGWICFESSEEEIILYLPKNVDYYLRKALI